MPTSVPVNCKVKFLTYCIYFMELSQINMSQFAKFLVQAQKNTFAGGQENHLSDGSTFAEYQDETFFFKDVWYGSSKFLGQQIMIYKPTGEKFWGVGYWGIDLNKEMMNKGGNDFLKLALRNVPEEFPVRGPQSFHVHSYPDLFYNNNWSCNFDGLGCLSGFDGKDIIYKKDIRIFYLGYVGGFIQK